MAGTSPRLRGSDPLRRCAVRHSTPGRAGADARGRWSAGHHGGRSAGTPGLMAQGTGGSHGLVSGCYRPEKARREDGLIACVDRRQGRPEARAAGALHTPVPLGTCRRCAPASKTWPGQHARRLRRLDARSRLLRPCRKPSRRWSARLSSSRRSARAGAPMGTGCPFSLTIPRRFAGSSLRPRPSSRCTPLCGRVAGAGVGCGVQLVATKWTRPRRDGKAALKPCVILGEERVPVWKKGTPLA